VEIFESGKKKLRIQSTRIRVDGALVVSLSNNDNDGRWKHHQKNEFASFKPYRVYFEPLNESNVGDF